MRFVISATAVAVGFVAFASAAQAQVSAYVGAGYSRNDRTGAGGVDLNGDFYALEAAIANDGGTFGAAAQGSIVYSESAGFKETALMFTGHVNKRFGPVLIGGFFGVDNSDDLGVWGGGLETLIDITPSVSLYGQAGYGRTDDLGFDDTDLWAGRVDVRIYPLDNLRVQIGGGYQQAKIAPGLKTEASIFGAEAEYRFPGTALSVRAGYDKYQVDDLMLDANIFRLGARYSFGGTLRERDRSGAGLGTVNRLFALENVAR